MSHYVVHAKSRLKKTMFLIKKNAINQKFNVFDAENGIYFVTKTV